MSAGRRVTGVLAGVMLVGSTAGALGRMTTTTSSETRTPTSPFSSIRLDGDAGDVRVVAREGITQPLVQITTRGGWSTPENTVEVVGDELRITASCSRGSWPAPCSSSFVLTVPSGVSVDLRTGTGDQELDGRFSAVRSELGTGDLTWTGDGDRLDVQGGAGDVEVRGAVADAAARTGTGDVDLVLTAVPETVEASAGTGDVTVLVPGTAEYAVTVQTGTGDRDVQLLSVPGAPHRISASTSTGDVTVAGI